MRNIMKINPSFIKDRIQNLPWAKISNITKKSAKYIGISFLTLASANYCIKFNEKYEDEKIKYQTAIKNEDIIRYNKMIEQIAINKAHGDLNFWQKGYEKMTDSIRIADRAYFEGAQMVRDSLKSMQK